MRRRIRIQQYKPSASAKELATYLGIKRIKIRNSRFRPRPTDIILNWGNVNPVHNAIYLNPISSVVIAANKLKTFQALQEASIPVPTFTTSLPTAGKWVARTTLTGHSGQGIVVAEAEDLPQAPLYVEYIKKDAEFRIIVVNGKVVDAKQKRKKLDWEAERIPYVWNIDNGYVYAREGIEMTPELEQLAINTAQALDLAYTALDIIRKDDQYYVLEANTAFGVGGSTVQLVGDALKELIQSHL